MSFNITISGITGGTQISTVQILECTDGDCNSCTLIPSYGSVLLSTLNTPGITITNINDNTSYIKIAPNGVCSGNTLCLPVQITPTQLFWSITENAGGGITIYDKDNNILLNENVTLSESGKNGTLTVSELVLPYKIKGFWQNGSGNIVNFIVCDLSTPIQLYTSVPIDNFVGYDEYIVDPTPLNVSVTMWKDGQPSAICPI